MSTQGALSSCQATVAPSLSFFQTVPGMIVIGLVGVGAGFAVSQLFFQPSQASVAPAQLIAKRF